MTKDEINSVMIIRQRRGPDIIGLVVGYKTREEGISKSISTYMIEYPFVPVIDYATGSFSLVPWCPFTDQTVFEFHTKDIVFMVPAKEDLSVNYLTGLTSRNAISLTDTEQMRLDKIAFQEAIEKLTLSPGTETLQ